MAGLFGAPRGWAVDGPMRQNEQYGSPYNPEVRQQVEQPMQQPAAMGGKPKINWLGVLADGLAGAAGKPGPYAAMMMRQREQAEARAEDQRSRSLDWSDWQRKQQWERDNPNPTQPHRWESNDGSLMELGPDGPRVAYQDPTPRMNFIPDGYGGGRWEPMPTRPTGGQLPVIGSVVPDPRRQGGPMPQASGGFPR